MKNIPEWVVKVIKTDSLNCNKCRVLFKMDSLISIGIQESSLEPHEDKLCVGMYCDNCKEMTIFELKEMTLIEFAFEILEKETEPKDRKEKNKIINNPLDILGENKKVKRRKPIPRSKITKKEIRDSVKFLGSIKTHEEFLVAMGLSPEQIKQYDYKKSDEE